MRHIRNGAKSVETHQGVGQLLKAGVFVCTATLVSPRVLLTAAHCVPYGPEAYVFQSGDFKSKITAKIIHAQYSSNPQYIGATSDLALLKLETPSPATPYKLSSIAESELPELPKGLAGTIVGFGYDGISTDPVPDSRHVPTSSDRSGPIRAVQGASGTRLVGSLYFHSLANAYLGRSAEKANGIALFASGASNQSGCLGDSGGPVLLDQRPGEIFGILSAGDSDMCSRTRVTFYVAVPAFSGDLAKGIAQLDPSFVPNPLVAYEAPPASELTIPWADREINPSKIPTRYTLIGTTTTRAALSASQTPVSWTSKVVTGGSCNTSAYNAQVLSAQYDFGNPVVAACIPEQPAYTNYGKAWPGDLNIATQTKDGVLSVTTSPAIAGAISSVKLGSTELVNALRGAGFQWNMHANWRYDCFNPTEAGGWRDDLDVITRWPFFGVSSSWLTSHAVDATANATTGGIAIRSGNYPAFYATYNSPTHYDYTGCNPTVYYDPMKKSPSAKSDWYLQKQVSLGDFRTYTNADGTPIDNVLTFSGQVTLPISYGLIDMQSAWFTSANVFKEIYLYNPYTATTSEGGSMLKVPVAMGSSGVPLIAVASNTPSSIAVGVYAPDAFAQGDGQSAPELTWAYYPTKASSYSNVPHVQIAVTNYYRLPTVNKPVLTTGFYVVGTLKSVKATLWSLARLHKSSRYVGRYTTNPVECSVVGSVVAYDGQTSSTKIPITVYGRPLNGTVAQRTVLATAEATYAGAQDGYTAVSRGWYGFNVTLPADKLTSEQVIDVVPSLGNGTATGPMIPSYLTPSTLKCVSKSAQLARYWSPAKSVTTQNHWSPSQALGLGYDKPAGNVGWVSTVPGTGKVPLYSCYDHASFDDTPGTSCAGARIKNLLGYVWTKSGAGTVPLYRCAKQWEGTRNEITNSNTHYDHPLTLSLAECPNGKADAALGYVATSAAAVATLDGAVVGNTPSPSPSAVPTTAPQSPTTPALVPVYRMYKSTPFRDLYYSKSASAPAGYTYQGPFFKLYASAFGACTIKLSLCTAGTGRHYVGAGCGNDTVGETLGYSCGYNLDGKMAPLALFMNLTTRSSFTGPVGLDTKLIETSAYDYIAGEGMTYLWPLGYAY